MRILFCIAVIWLLIAALIFLGGPVIVSVICLHRFIKKEITFFEYIQYMREINQQLLTIGGFLCYAISNLIFLII